MTDSKYLIQRKLGWYFQMAVPTDLQPRFPGKKIVKSLQTRSLPVAQRRRWILYGELQQQFTLLRNKTPIQDPWQSASGILELAQATRAQVESGAVDLDQARQEWSTAMDVAFDDGTDSPQVEPPLVQAVKLSNRVISGEVSELLSTAIESHLSELAPTVRHQTVDTKRRRLESLLSYLGPVEIGEITRKQLGHYVSQVILPVDRSFLTKRQWGAAIASFFAWSITRGLIEVNPALGLAGSIKDTKRGTREKLDSKRRAWNPAELLALIARAETEEGIESSLYAMVSIAAYSGMRAEEIATMRLEDMENGCFVVEEGKTDSSIRSIPIHPSIVELVARLAGGRVSGYLIQGMKRSGPDDKRAHITNQRFSKRIRIWGFSDKRLCFHSIRKSFATALEESGCPENVAKQLLGHAKSSLSYGLYSSGVSVEVLRSAVEKVKY